MNPVTAYSGLLRRVGGRLSSSFKNQTLAEHTKAFLSGDDIPVKGTTTSLAQTVSAFWGCNRVLAETFASTPVHEYKRLKNGDKVKTDDTGYFDILHNVPNNEMSAYNFHEMSMFQINLGGNLVAVRQKSAARLTRGLYPFQWENVKIGRNKDTKQLEYVVKVGNQKEITYTRDQVFHVPGLSMNGVTGMSTMSFAASSINLAKTYEEFGTRFFKNGVMTTGAFEHPRVLKEIPYQRLKEDMQKNWQGLVNAGKPLILEDGMQFKPMNMNLNDAELLLSKKYQVEDIARFFRVPLHLIQMLDQATNNNIEKQSLEFVMYTMLPWYKRYEGAINTQLVTPSQRKAGYFFEFNMAGLLRGDQKSMAEAFAKGRQWGYLSVNDIRRMLNMNSIGPEGDIYLQPVNMVPAGTDQQDIRNSMDQMVRDMIKEEVDNIMEEADKKGTDNG